MGMYVCGPCIKENNITVVPVLSAVVQCEICGHTKNDWEPKLCGFTWQLTRFGKTVEDQLKEINV